jgi:hypothetical protein
VSLYGTSVVKRLSKAQAHALDAALLNIAAVEKPTSVRGMYYMAMGAGLIDKDAQAKRNNYMRVQRRLLQMRRDGRMPYSGSPTAAALSMVTTASPTRTTSQSTPQTSTARTTGSSLRFGSRSGSRRTQWPESLSRSSVTSTD